MDRNEIKQKLTELINRYNNSLRLQDHANISEETIRTWLNEFLSIFGWDVQNANQVLQERVLRGTQRQRLQEINSPHSKPDYMLLNGGNIKSFLDAKSLDINIFTDENAAYCIYAVDCDEAAIEVTKMSLALKIVDGNSPLAWEGVGAFGDKVLREIADNIKLGNALFSEDEEELRVLKAFLESDAFWYYIFHTSKPYSKGYMAFAKNYLVKFAIPDLSKTEVKYLLSNPHRKELNSFIWKKYGINPTELKE